MLLCITQCFKVCRCFDTCCPDVGGASFLASLRSRCNFLEPPSASQPPRRFIPWRTRGATLLTHPKRCLSILAVTKDLRGTLERLTPGAFIFHLPGPTLPGFPDFLESSRFPNRQSHDSSGSHPLPRGPHSSPGPLFREKGASFSRERPPLFHFN